jgi:hypothetical protein
MANSEPIIVSNFNSFLSLTKVHASVIEPGINPSTGMTDGFKEFSYLNLEQPQEYKPIKKVYLNGTLISGPSKNGTYDAIQSEGSLYFSEQVEQIQTVINNTIKNLLSNSGSSLYKLVTYTIVDSFCYYNSLDFRGPRPEPTLEVSQPISYYINPVTFSKQDFINATIYNLELIADSFTNNDISHINVADDEPKPIDIQSELKRTNIAFISEGSSIYTMSKFASLLTGANINDISISETNTINVEGGVGANIWSLDTYIRYLKQASIELLNAIALTWNEIAITDYIFTYHFSPNEDDLTTTELEEITPPKPNSSNDKDLRAKMRSGHANNTFYLDDYNWGLNEKDSFEKMQYDVNSFPYIRLYELQVDLQISYKKILNTAKQNTVGYLERITNNAVFKEITSSSVFNLVGTYVGNMITSNSIDAEGASKINNLANAIGGDWVGQYDVPFFANSFLKADSKESWSMGTGDNDALNRAENLLIQNGFNLNAQEMPEWKFSQGAALDWTNTFYLVNDNIDNFFRNFEFLMALTAGNYWVQSSGDGLVGKVMSYISSALAFNQTNQVYYYRPPNLFRIYSPGRFLMLFAALSIDVNFIGKTKYYSPLEMSNLVKGNSSMEAFKSQGFHMPEAFEIKMVVKDLTPQCFNIVAGFYHNESGVIPNLSSNRRLERE